MSKIDEIRMLLSQLGVTRKKDEKLLMLSLRNILLSKDCDMEAANFIGTRSDVGGESKYFQLKGSFIHIRAMWKPSALGSAILLRMLEACDGMTSQEEANLSEAIFRKYA